MKIVFVNRYFYPDISATSQILTDLVRALRKEGMAVEVLASRQCYDNPGAKLPTLDTCDGVPVYRVGNSAFGRANLVGRALDYLSFYFGSLRHLRSSLSRDDIVVAKTDPPLLGVLLAPVIRSRNARQVNWYQDLFPEVAENIGIRLPGRAYRLLEKWRDANAREAVANVVVGDRMRRYVQSRGIAAERLHTIHNWSPLSTGHSSEEQTARLRELWGLTGKVVVAYSGNLGRAHDWQTILASAVELREHPDVLFLMIGGGAGMQLLKGGVREQALTNVVFQSYQPLERLRASLSVADVHLASLLPGVGDFLVPSKVYGVMAVGRPLIFIGEDDSEVGDMLRRYNCGVMVRPGESSMLGEKIRYLSENTEEMYIMGERGRQMYEENYSAAKAHAAWQHLLADII